MIYISQQNQYYYGVITEEELTKVFEKYFPDRDASRLIARFKRDYAQDSQGVIDFKAFMLALFKTSPLDGALNHIAFKMCDVDSTGIIQRQEVRMLLVVCIL